jgi:predicted DNA-binding transcriptional regulator AlpA
MALVVARCGQFPSEAGRRLADMSDGVSQISPGARLLLAASENRVRRPRALDERGGFAMAMTDVMDHDELLRPAEVLRILKVSKTWLYDAAKNGRIPCVRLGGPDGPLRFERAAIQALIRQSRIG